MSVGAEEERLATKTRAKETKSVSRSLLLLFLSSARLTLLSIEEPKRLALKHSEVLIERKDENESASVLLDKGQRGRRVV